MEKIVDDNICQLESKENQVKDLKSTVLERDSKIKCLEAELQRCNEEIVQNHNVIDELKENEQELQKIASESKE